MVTASQSCGHYPQWPSIVEDDGGNPTSAIEIGTKLVSREAAFKACGAQTSPSLDQGDRCKSINQERLTVKSHPRNCLYTVMICYNML